MFLFVIFKKPLGGLFSVTKTVTCSTYQMREAMSWGAEEVSLVYMLKAGWN